MKKLTVFLLLSLVVVLGISAADGDAPSKGLDFSVILNVILGVVSVVFGGFLLKFKDKFSQAISLCKEIVDVGSAIEEELKDNNLDEKGKVRILKEWSDVKTAFKVFITFNKKR